MTLLEENIARLKAEGKYHPDAIQASPEPVKVESVLVPATVTDPSARELARRAVAPDNDASLSGDLRKLWNKLREHSSDNPITKTTFVNICGRPKRTSTKTREAPVWPEISEG